MSGTGSIVKEEGRQKGQSAGKLLGGAAVSFRRRQYLIAGEEAGGKC